MRSFKRVFAFFAVGVLAALAVIVLLRVQSQEKFHAQNQNSKEGKLKEMDDDATPIVDLIHTNAPDAKRWSKNSRHDGHRWIRANLGATVFEVLTEQPHNVADLPAAESDLIVEGEAIGSAAFLSNDKNNVYSEFTIRVAKTFKAADLSVSTGDAITAERPGGRVRYPDGRIVRYRVVGQGSPRTGRTYVFFLLRGDPDTYKILTAYEVADGKVSALDGARTNRGVGKWVFDKHIDQDYASFITEVTAAINRPRISSQPKSIGP